MGRLGSLSILLSALLLIGCSTETEPPYVAESPAPDRPSANPSVNLGTPVASSVEGVPIPESAILKHQATPTDATYYLPETVTLEDLSAWYDEHLPRGTDWQGWSWCEESHDIDGGEFGFQRLYVRQGTAAILSVLLGRGRTEPTFVIIGTDESGPCT